MIAAPHRYENRLIEFRARFSSDCYHGYDVMSDMPCRYRGLGAYVDRSMPTTKSRVLYDALCPSQRDTDVTGVFTAIVRRVPDDSNLLRLRGGFELALVDYRGLKQVKRPPY